MTGNNHINEKINQYAMMILILPAILPAGFTGYTAIGNILAKLQYFSFFLIFLMSVVNFKFRKNKLIVAVFLFCLTLFTITAWNNGNILETVKRFESMLLPVMWMHFMIRRNEKQTLKFLVYYFGLLSILNALMILFLPLGLDPAYNNGGNQIYLLGIDNKIAFITVPVFGLALVYIDKYCKPEHKTLLCICAAIVFILPEFLMWVGSGIVGFLIVVLLLLFYKVPVVRRYLTLNNCLIATGILLFIVLSRPIREGGVLARFIVDVLHKDISFSGRTVLWNQTVDLIKKSPVFGYGLQEMESYGLHFTDRHGIHYGFSPHNGFLLLLLYGGVVLCLAYINIILSAGKIKYIRETWNKNIEYLIFTLIAFWIMAFVEAEYTSFTFLLALEALDYYASQPLRKTSIHI